MASILIADDEPQFRNMLKQALERFGHEVREAPNGKAALRLQQEKKADLLITDIIMPEQEGLETIREFRRLYSEMKIIAVSGGGRIGPEEYLQLARRMGAQRVFSKPFGLSEFLQAVKELLASSTPQK